MARSTAAVDLQPIDRLEDKVRQLVSMIDTLRADRAKALDDVARLEREIAALRTRLGDAEGAAADVTALREERDQIRDRVAQMIAQIDKLSL